ncbi:MAG: hypothetical protein GXP47_15195 [Acidobacteria bacterium]|nr:hypothetical protein [Acidobacteriota bacterium]
MSSRGLRALGLALVLAGGAWTILWSLWLAAQHRSGQLDAAAAILGLLLFAFLPAMAAWAGGAVVLIRANRLARQEAEASLETRIAEALRTRGIVRLTPLARELGMPEPELRRAVERLVGLRLLPGRIDWERGELLAPYARVGEACPRCGGQLEPAGKGLLACRYCGSRFPMEGDEENAGD